MPKRWRWDIAEDQRILPSDTALRIPGFLADYSERSRTLAPAAVRCEDWFDGFVSRVVKARGRSFVPICRMSDGEFLFALGPQPPDRRLNLVRRLWQRSLADLEYARRRGGFAARTQGRYHSGDYTAEEWARGRAEFGGQVSEIARSGILAIHLTYGARPFQEKYFPALGAWLDINGIRLTVENYVPFYFVYALLTGNRAREVLGGRVLVINGETGEKRERIEKGLRRAGASTVYWHTISQRRSLFDHVDVSKYYQRVDVAVVGAGIGKARLLSQLQALAVPCIDAGYVFEVWADPRAGGGRPYCLPDQLRDPAAGGRIDV